MNPKREKNSFPENVVIHPTVLLSVVDHYNRLAKETNRRVVGALLGEYIDDKVDITNCYAIPFEEDPKDKKIWYLDHICSEEMFQKAHHCYCKLVHTVCSRTHAPARNRSDCS